MASILVLSLAVGQIPWTFYANRNPQSVWSWILVESLVFHASFFTLSVHTARLSDYRVPADLIFPIAVAFAADLICFVMDFAALNGMQHNGLVWLILIPFAVLLFEVFSVCTKIERRA